MSQRQPQEHVSTITYPPLPLPSKFSIEHLQPRVLPSVKISRSSQREGGVGFEVTVPAGSQHEELAEAYRLAVEFYRAFERDVLGAQAEPAQWISKR